MLYEVITIIEQGEREFTYRGEKTNLKKNDTFIIQPFEPHRCKSLNNTKHCYKIISLNLNTLFYFPQLVIQHHDLLNYIKEFHALAEYEKSTKRVNKLYEEIRNNFV